MALVDAAVAQLPAARQVRSLVGSGVLYGRYCAADSDELPLEHFPILWDGSSL